MLNIDDNGLFEIFPMIQTISESFEYQNSMLNKIVLTGKISALEIAENLFNFTEQTAQTFAELQSELIVHMLKENKKELYTKAYIKAKIVGNLFIRSLELRGFDINYLANDEMIIDYLIHRNDKDSIKTYLTNTQNSIYKDILLLDTKGKALLNINEENHVKYTKDKILKIAKQTDDFIQVFDATDMFISQKKSLFFIKRVMKNNQHIGYVVMFYNLQGEIGALFKDLIEEKESIIITNLKNDILISSEKGLDKNFIKKIKKLNEFVIINNKVYLKTKISSQNNGIDDIYVVISYPKREDINIVAEFSNESTNNRKLVNINLNNKELKKLADDGYEILEDLSDVIINGELIAAKSKQYILIPILDNLREVSFKVVKLIELSISNLQKIIDDSISNNVKLVSEMFIKLIVRNLYEMSNNIRLWAQNKVIINSLQEKDCDKLASQLRVLNDAYSMYSDIFVYDNNGKVLATSNSDGMVGEVIENNYTSNNKDKNRYFITPFAPTKMYNNKPTYIFYASIIDEHNHVIGGIGAVFDSITQFSNMLKMSFNEENGIGLLVDENKTIVSSSIDKFKVLDKFTLIDSNNFIDGYISDIEFDNKLYKICITKSQDYREFKSNNLYSIIMMEK